MKQLITTFGIFLITLTLSAQEKAADAGQLKQQGEALKIEQRLNERKLKLAKLENTLPKKTSAMESAVARSQKSADENKSIAARLAKDAQDKKLAHKADKSASRAKKDARQARKATDDLDDLKKDIQSLKKDIAQDEGKLATLQEEMHKVPAKE